MNPDEAKRRYHIKMAWMWGIPLLINFIAMIMFLPTTPVAAVLCMLAATASLVMIWKNLYSFDHVQRGKNES